MGTQNLHRSITGESKFEFFPQLSQKSENFPTLHNFSAILGKNVIFQMKKIENIVNEVVNLQNILFLQM
jgi:bisphosphoglycerate-independent phosphoglycerate mutase (AlkP superfamily)